MLAPWPIGDKRTCRSDLCNNARLCSKKQIDIVVLIAGDSDLVPAVEASKEEGAIVQLYYVKRSVSDELLNVCDERYEIGQALIDQTSA